MLEFETELVYTGHEKRTNQKSGTEYVLTNFLDEKGQTFGCVTECNINHDIVQLDRVRALLKVVPGRYTQLRVLEMEKILV